MHLLRNLGRRKLRSFLTISGIAIGIMALVVFGSMANKMNALISGGSKYYADKDVVSIGSMFTGAIQPLSLGDVEKIKLVEGVAVATPSIDMMLDDSTTATMGTPEMISGSIADGDQGLETFKVYPATGRLLEPSDTGNQTVLGSDLARKMNAKVGGTVTLRDTQFEVVGILQPTLTAPDKSAMVPLGAAQKLFMKTLPPMLQSAVNVNELATSIIVYPKAGVEP